jgi:hypothetical protein
MGFGISVFEYIAFEHVGKTTNFFKALENRLYLEQEKNCNLFLTTMLRKVNEFKKACCRKGCILYNG